MYRQYENPIEIHKMLEEAKAAYEAAKQDDPENTDRLIDLANEVESLRERENFAWQDEEYDEDNSDDWRPGDAPWDAPGMSESDFIC